MTLFLQTLPSLLEGLRITLLVSAGVIALSLLIGVPLGCVLAFGPLWARFPIRIYADFVRGVPILVLLYFVYYGLPAIKVNLPSLTAAIVALTAFTGTVLVVLRVTSFIRTEKPHVFGAQDLGDGETTRVRGMRAKGNAVVGDGVGDGTASRP